MRYAVFNIRVRSLLRGVVLVIGSVILAIPLAGFPDIRPSPLMLLPTLLTAWGTWETIRCLQRRWSFYHGGVLLLLYADILALALVVFLLLYPYAQWLQGH
ncbi:MAG: permease [Acidobacteriaceae bacterium]